MLKKEFESLTGKTVSDEDFILIHRIYMASGEMDKATFCKNWKPEMLENPIVAALAVGAETWIKAQMNTAEELNKTKAGVDGLMARIGALARQSKGQADEIALLKKAVYATVEQINLPVFPSLQNKFNDIFGTSEVIRMRHNNGWDLSREEVEWLLDHCED